MPRGWSTRPFESSPTFPHTRKFGMRDHNHPHFPQEGRQNNTATRFDHTTRARNNNDVNDSTSKDENDDNFENKYSLISDRIDDGSCVTPYVQSHHGRCQEAFVVLSRLRRPDKPQPFLEGIRHGGRIHPPTLVQKASVRRRRDNGYRLWKYLRFSTTICTDTTTASSATRQEPLCGNTR